MQRVLRVGGLVKYYCQRHRQYDDGIQQEVAEHYVHVLKLPPEPVYCF